MAWLGSELRGAFQSRCPRSGDDDAILIGGSVEDCVVGDNAKQP